MGPFHTPWLTFTALIVTFASVVFSIIWAIISSKKDE